MNWIYTICLIHTAKNLTRAHELDLYKNRILNRPELCVLYNSLSCPKNIKSERREFWKKKKKDGGIAREKADSIENCRCTKDL